VKVSYLQIYNEVISDLLKSDRNNLQIREDKKRGISVEGLSEWIVKSPLEIYSLLRKGTSSRVTASNKLNDISSRSHAVFVITVEQMGVEEQVQEEPIKLTKIGKLNLVDLAGSERLSITGATGKRLEECKKINQSLSTLGNVIAALTDTKSRVHIPYRDSKLTRLLEDSLGGNCKTTMMTMISPSYMCFSETLSSLKFANRAKNIRNDAKINEELDHKSLIKKYEAEVKMLKKALEERNKDVMDKELVLRLEEVKKRADEDRMVMTKIIEMRSKEYMQEKESKKVLAEKLKMLMSQSGIKEEKTSDKLELEKYKQLLTKQRDIMIALTARLDERDEIIIKLQEKLDVYEKLQRELQETLERQRLTIKQMQELLAKEDIKFTIEDKHFDTTFLYKRYTPYLVDCGEAKGHGLSLLTAEEKIIELMDIIESYKGDVKQKDIKLIELKSENKSLIEDKHKLLSQIDSLLLCNAN